MKRALLYYSNLHSRGEFPVIREEVCRERLVMTLYNIAKQKQVNQPRLRSEKCAGFRVINGTTLFTLLLYCYYHRHYCSLCPCCFYFYSFLFLLTLPRVVCLCVLQVSVDIWESKMSVRGDRCHTWRVREAGKGVTVT